MRRDRFYILAVTDLAAILICASAAWAAPKYKVLHGFSGGNDGAGLWSSVVFDKTGNLYGTTKAGGGSNGYGTVFELMPHPDGSWSEKLLHVFCNNCHDGQDPQSNLAFDESGNLYGLTLGGGPFQHGTVFELTPNSDGTWTENILYAFGSKRQDGAGPHEFVMDGAGNIFGNGADIIFDASPGFAGWTENMLYAFCSESGCSDGNAPYAGPILDPAGNLYGTTENGGASSECPPPGCGTVYQLTHGSDGTWSESVLHDFGSSGTDGRRPIAGVYMDKAGSLYGATQGGGTLGYGTVFKLVPGPNGVWQEKVLYNFIGSEQGHGPGGGVVMDKRGTLYGTTVYGGTQCDCGVVYKLARSKGGKWKYTVLHRFSGADGAQPVANLILDNRRNLYGTTVIGGPGGDGVVFEVTP
jgi:uncharacterized repeat protein (TIGR03803 family)